MELTIKVKTKKRCQEHIISITRLHMINFEEIKICLLRVCFHSQIHLVIYHSSKNPFPIRKNENIKTNNRIKILADIYEFTVLDTDETPKVFLI